MNKELMYMGMSATPPDYECPDGELELAVNMLDEDNGMRVVVGGREAEGYELGEGEEALIIHVVNSGEKHLIIKRGNQLCYRIQGEYVQEQQQEHQPLHVIKEYTNGSFKCSATGNMLCVYGYVNIEHFLFVHGNYIPYNTSDFNISVLFGIEKEERQSDSLTMTGIIGGGQEDLNLSSTFRRVMSGNFSTAVGLGYTNIDVSLPKDHYYRMRLVNNNTSGNNLTYTITYNGGSGQSVTQGDHNSNVYYTFKPTFDVTDILVVASGGTAETGGVTGTVVHYYTIDQEEHNVVQTEGGLPAWTPWHYNGYDTNINNEILGLENKLFADIRDDKKFSMPFFVRYGFRMLGGDIITASAPILIEPNVGANKYTNVPVIELTITNQNPPYADATVTAKMFAGTLKYKVRSADVQRLQELIDNELVESLVIAVSDPIYLYNQAATDEDMQTKTFITDKAPQIKSYAIEGVEELVDRDIDRPRLALPCIDKDYKDRLAGESVFKIIKEIPASKIKLTGGFHEVELDDGVLEGLAGNMNIMPDNIENLSDYSSQTIVEYNQREHLVGAIQNQFVGFDLDGMSGFVQDSRRQTNYRTYIKTYEDAEERECVRGIRNEESSNRRWIYFPNANAKHIDLYERIGTNENEHAKKYELQLTKHDYLSGAFYFDEDDSLSDASSGGEEDTDGNIEDVKQTIENEKLNMLYVSMQGNPLVIEQRVRVGDGIIYAAAANTRPISRGQYGTAPLFIFSTDGIWGLELSSDGKYSARQAPTRDVCTNTNGDNIAHIDSAVVFATDRGLMMLADADAGSVCFSDILNAIEAADLSQYPHIMDVLGELSETCNSVVPFSDFLVSARTLYDYTHQRIVVYNPVEHEGELVHPYAYVFSIKSKKWGIIQSDIRYSIGNSYPECLVVDGNNSIIDLSKNDDEQEQTDGIIITRPLKLDAPDILKTIETVIQRGKFKDGHIKSVLYGSRDLFHWVPVWSSNNHVMRGFRGTPYKYFRIVLICNLGKDESVFGCTVQYTPRLTDKVR